MAELNKDNNGAFKLVDGPLPYSGVWARPERLLSRAFSNLRRWWKVRLEKERYWYRRWRSRSKKRDFGKPINWSLWSFVMNVVLLSAVCAMLQMQCDFDKKLRLFKGDITDLTERVVELGYYREVGVEDVIKNKKMSDLRKEGPAEKTQRSDAAGVVIDTVRRLLP